MLPFRKELAAQAETYAAERGISLGRFLGEGNDGAVWETSRRSALKVLERFDSYQRERDAYLRLTERNTFDIEGFAVPQLIGHDDTLQSVEMTIVFPPCIIDFAKSYVDRPPDYPAEALSDWEAATAEQFGDKWPSVQSILASFRLMGIYYYDARQGNIRFGDE